MRDRSMQRLSGWRLIRLKCVGRLIEARHNPDRDSKRSALAGETLKTRLSYWSTSARGYSRALGQPLVVVVVSCNPA